MQPSFAEQCSIAAIVCNSLLTFLSAVGGQCSIHVQSSVMNVQDNKPLEFHMLGVDLYMNSHFDDWIVDVTSWRPGTIDDGEWAVPHFCKQNDAKIMQRHHLDSSLAMEVARQLPNPHHGTILPAVSLISYNLLVVFC